ncbi:plasmid partitioning protein RepB C-terminal domain-containing protein [Elioraea sp.]|uniref:plasmid partitioning protein RepB C-terminal domain-containing protein n=1 Tax=Elioraea sp. TaxID=2185103 RepID=UPI003F7217CB
MIESTTGKGVRHGFERESVVVPLAQLAPLKVMRPGTKESHKYAQILTSVRAVGLVEAPVVTPDRERPGRYFLLDGHLRIEALRDLGVTEVECLVATDDETYSYNKRINRLPPIQEHRMILRAIDRGVPEERIAEALGVEVQTIRRHARLLNGICPEAAEILKETSCPAATLDVLRCMGPIRQVEAAELMSGQNNYTASFAKAILAATPEAQLVEPRTNKLGRARTAASEQIMRLERELASLQAQVRSVEETYGIDNLHLTVAKGYVRKLLGNARIVRWLSQHHPEYLSEFQSIAEIDSLLPADSTAA